MSTVHDPTTLRRFLDRFELLLKKPVEEAKDELKGMLVTYGELCDATNDRLRACYALVQKGQPVNAVALAGREPSLLEWASLLQFSRAEILPKVAEALQMSPVTPIDTALVQVVQDAHERVAKGAADLRALQRLTLARAPLPTRLAVLRRMYQADHDHPFHERDIRAYEQAWLRQVPAFVDELAQEGRADVIREVIQDLLENGYLEVPSKDLIARLRKALARAAQAALPELARQVKAAYAANDYEAMEPAAGRWRVASSDAGQADADAKYGVVEALAWFDAEQFQRQLRAERQTALAALDELLADPEATRDELVDAYRALEDLGEVEPDVAVRYRAAIDAIDHAASRARIAKLVGGVAVVAVVLGGIIYLAKQPSGFEGPADGADPAPSQATPATPPADALAALIEEIRGMPADGDIEAVRKKAETVAAADPEKLRQIEQEIQLWEKKSSVLFDEAAGKLLERARRAAESARTAAEPAAVAGAIEALRKEIADQRGRPGKTPQGETDLASAERQLAAADRWVGLTSGLAQLRDALRGKSATPEVLERLAEWIDKAVPEGFPDADLAAHARRARGSLAGWKKAVELQRLLRSGVPLDDKEAAAWVDQPPAAVVEALRDLGGMQAQRRADSPGSEASRLAERLAERDMVDLWMVSQLGHDAIKKRFAYYTAEPQPAPKVAPKVNVLKDRSGATRAMSLPTDEFRSAEAPQSLFAREARAALFGRDPEADWHATLARLYDGLVDRRYKDIDPLLALNLARRFLAFATKASAGYRAVLAAAPGYGEVVGADAQIEGNWVYPDSALDDPRIRADAYLKKAPRLAGLAGEAAERDKNLDPELRRGVVAAGWVGRDASGAPSLVPFDGAGAEPPRGAVLYTVEDGQWVRLGPPRLTAVPALEELARLYPGWPVFAVSAPR